MNSDSNDKYTWDGIDRRDIPAASRTPVKIYIIAIAIAAAVFAFDLMAPLGVAGGVPYVIFVLFGWWFQERPAVFFLAIGASVLTILGYFLSPEGGTGLVVLTNRSYAIVVIWAAASVLWWAWRERRARPPVLKTEQEQEQKNFGREGVAVVVLAIVIAASAWGVLSRVEAGAKADIDKSLNATLETAYASIRNEVKAEKNTAKVWADNSQIQRAVVELLELPQTPVALTYSNAQVDLRVMVKSFFSTVGYRGFFVIGKNNINLASSRNVNIGVVNLLSGQGNFLDRIWAGETLVSLPQESDVPLEDITGRMVEGLSTMFVATPVKSIGGDVIAVLAFRLDPDETFSPILQRGFFGESDETYAFDEHGHMISESRFNAALQQIGLISDMLHSGLNMEIRDPGVNLLLGQKPVLPRHKQPLTTMAKSATAGNNGINLDGYRDYRGVPVVGVWLWDAELGFGIATEMDVEEAYNSFKNIRFIIFVFSGLSIGVLIFLAALSSRSRRQIVESEKRYRNVINSTAEGYGKVDVQGRLLEVNKAFCDMLGHASDELLGKRPYEFATGKNRADFELKVSETMASPQSQYDVVFEHKNGKAVHASVSATGIKDNHGKITGAFAFVTDITERKKAEKRVSESEELLSAAINNISDGFVLCDANNRIVLFNSRFKALYPNSRDLIQKGTLFEDFLREGAKRDEYPDAVGRVDKWVAERKLKGRERGASFDQQLVGDRWVQISIGRLPDGGWVGIHVDITPFKEAIESADKANLAKSEFLSSMSHELRTPLNAILGFAQMLEFNPKEPLSGLQKESVDHIMRGGQHLLELINDILDLTRIEAGKVELSIENISPAKILEECLSLIVNMAEARGIKISTPDAAQEVPLVLADHTRFKQVLLNFMSNAVKYNRENGTVFIDFEETGAGTLRISVTDTGEGIAEDKQIELFKPFSRLGAENTEIEGTGIGLVVCKDLINLMDGAVGMESEVGKGSSFWFELPLSLPGHKDFVATQETDLAQTEENLARGSGTMLYVEDNPDNLKLMELIVSRMEGLTMISTHTGELGIEMARAERPDLIILDINLPGMNGIETLKKLQSHASTNKIPVLALSAAATARDIEKGMEAGFLRYLTKPILVPEVMEAINTAMKKA